LKRVESESGGGQIGRRTFGRDPEALAVGGEGHFALLVGAVGDRVVETL